MTTTEYFKLKLCEVDQCEDWVIRTDGTKYYLILEDLTVYDVFDSFSDARNFAVEQLI